MNVIAEIEAEQVAAIEEKRKLPEFSPGDTVRVLVRVTEGTRTRIQAYEGVCIARQGSGLNQSFTVRKISYGEGVERVFPAYSPLVEGVEIVRRGRVRRAKLYYLRERRGKSARIVENTNTRSRKLNDAERAAFMAEKGRLEAEKVAAAQALATEKAAEDAAAVRKLRLSQNMNANRATRTGRPFSLYLQCAPSSRAPSRGWVSILDGAERPNRNAGLKAKAASSARTVPRSAGSSPPPRRSLRRWGGCGRPD